MTTLQLYYYFYTTKIIINYYSISLTLNEIFLIWHKFYTMLFRELSRDNKVKEKIK